MRANISIEERDTMIEIDIIPMVGCEINLKEVLGDDFTLGDYSTVEYIWLRKDDSGFYYDIICSAIHG